MAPRRTALYRPDPRNPRLRRAVVANVDVVVIVAAVREPDLRPGLIDRYLVAIEQGGAQAALCLNKTDLEDDAHAASLAAVASLYRDLGLQVFPCSALQSSGLDPLRQLLAGKLAALVGHSGVGKSSLINALQPDLDLLTGSVSTEGSGRHTTTRATLYQLAGDVRIIDTPGIRELGLWQPTLDDLHEGFPDLAGAAGGCRFSNCSHSHEPGCGVQRAVEAGEVSAARYATYRRILDSLGDG